MALGLWGIRSGRCRKAFQLGVGVQGQRATNVPGRIALVALVGMGEVFRMCQTAFEPFGNVAHYRDIVNSWPEKGA